MASSSPIVDSSIDLIESSVDVRIDTDTTDTGMATSAPIIEGSMDLMESSVDVRIDTDTTNTRMATSAPIIKGSIDLIENSVDVRIDTDTRMATPAPIIEGSMDLMESSVDVRIDTDTTNTRMATSAPIIEGSMDLMESSVDVRIDTDSTDTRMATAAPVIEGSMDLIESSIDVRIATDTRSSSSSIIESSWDMMESLEDVRTDTDTRMASSSPIIESSMDLMENLLDVRLEYFVHYFVQDFEAKLKAYNAVLEGEGSKSGKFADKFGGIIGKGGGALAEKGLGSIDEVPSFVADGASTVVASGTEIIGKEIGERLHKRNVVAVWQVIDRWYGDKASFRGKLVEAGFDIFQSFEMQFMRADSGSGPRIAMKRLAKNAVNRAINHLRKDSEASISKSAILGDSKKAYFIFPGIGIRYKYLKKEKKWRIAHLYSKTGVVREMPGAPSSFHTKKDGKKGAAKYGFRRLLACENWSEEEKNYSSDDIAEIIREEFTDYRYILNQENSGEKIKKILDSYNSKDKE